jgi:hypothetical protein
MLLKIPKKSVPSVQSEKSVILLQPPGTAVEILEGPFRGWHGTTRETGTQTTLQVEIPSLGYVSRIELKGEGGCEGGLIR